MDIVAEDWRKTLKTSNQGEAGIVYYINLEAIFDDNTRWTKGTPFTLNPIHGKTLENVLKTSQMIPKLLKTDLLNKREGELKMGKVLFRFYISENQAPDTWGSQQHENAHGGIYLL